MGVPAEAEPSPFAAELDRRVTTAFIAAADPSRAGPMRSYMKDRFSFLGIAKPEREPRLRAAISSLGRPTDDDLEAFARRMWDHDEREFQYAACWVLRRHQRALTDRFLPTARHLIVTRSWWDTVDELAQNVVGAVVRRHRRLSDEMDRWIDEDDIWLARSALLHQNRWKADTDADRLFGYCRSRAGDHEFFIRKAIGWALREYSKTDGDAVRRFVADHDAELSGLSKREALRWLDRHPRGGI